MSDLVVPDEVRRLVADWRSATQTYHSALPDLRVGDRCAAFERMVQVEAHLCAALVAHNLPQLAVVEDNRVLLVALVPDVDLRIALTVIPAVIKEPV